MNHLFVSLFRFSISGYWWQCHEELNTVSFVVLFTLNRLIDCGVNFHVALAPAILNYGSLYSISAQSKLCERVVVVVVWTLTATESAKATEHKLPYALLCCVIVTLLLVCSGTRTLGISRSTAEQPMQFICRHKREPLWVERRILTSLKSYCCPLSIAKLLFNPSCNL